MNRRELKTTRTPLPTYRGCRFLRLMWLAGVQVGTAAEPERELRHTHELAFLQLCDGSSGQPLNPPAFAYAALRHYGYGVVAWRSARQKGNWDRS